MLRGRDLGFYCILACMAKWAAAAQTTGGVAHGMLGYDWTGLLIAFALGVAGGCARTLYALGARRVLVSDLPFVVLRDAMLGTGSTILVFMLCVANNALAEANTVLVGWQVVAVPRDVVGLLLFLAGISSGKVLFFASDFFTWFTLWVRRRVLGRDSPMPLQDTVSQEMK